MTTLKNFMIIFTFVLTAFSAKVLLADNEVVFNQDGRTSAHAYCEDKVDDMDIDDDKEYETALNLCLESWDEADTSEEVLEENEDDGTNEGEDDTYIDTEVE